MGSGVGFGVGKAPHLGGWVQPVMALSGPSRTPFLHSVAQPLKAAVPPFPPGLSQEHK